MNKVSSVSAIWCFIVISKYGQLFSSSNCNLYYMRHQVIRDSLWILSDKARSIRSDWIEVSQKYDRKFQISVCCIL